MLTLIRTTTFRLALIYAALFGVSAVALLLFIYWSTVGFMASQTDETIMAEIDGLEEQYRQRGLGGLNRLIIERSTRGGENLYLLVSPMGRPMSGNLSNFPPSGAAVGGWLDFDYQRAVADDAGRRDGVSRRAARARRLQLSGGYLLLVGRDIAERRAIERLITNSLGWAGLLTFALGVGGGVVISRNMMRRLEAVNRTSREIMRGDLSRRVRVTGSGDELDQLAVNLNAMLDQIERLMGGMREVSDNIAHDLRSPLTRLRNRLEATLLKPASDDGYRAALEDTIGEADRILETFNALLSIARVEAGTRRETLQVLDAEPIMRDIAELFAPVAQDLGLTLTCQVEASPRIRAARELIAQALANLLDNAVKYSGEGGRILMRLRSAPDGRAVIEVMDDGPGVPESERERVIARFVRLERSRTAPGSGLGLALVAAIAKLHGAKFELTDPPAGVLTAGAQSRGPGLLARLSFPNPEKWPESLS